MQILFLMASITGCSQRVECPKQTYPELQPIDKIPRLNNIVIEGGRFDQNSTSKVKKTLKALRVSEHYYFTTLSDYMREFN